MGYYRDGLTSVMRSKISAIICHYIYISANKSLTYILHENSSLFMLDKGRKKEDELC